MRKLREESDDEAPHDSSQNRRRAARCSTTVPEARTTKMGDGGFRPAYNMQFATDGDARMIVTVDVTNNGSDGGQLAPHHADVCRRYDKVPDNVKSLMTNDQRLPLKDLVALYALRWQIEQFFKELKSTLGVHSPASRTTRQSLRGSTWR